MKLVKEQFRKNVQINLKQRIIMKNIRKIVVTLVLFIGLFSCKAQTTVSLYQMEQCAKRLDKTVECPGFENVDITHVKDVDNRLNKFAGTWKGIYYGKQIELKIEKKIDFEEYGVKWDQLNGKLKIKDNQGNILFDSFSNPDLDANPYGVNFQGSAYEMSFMANGDCFDEGMLFLEMLPLSLNNPNSQMTIQFIRDTGGESTFDIADICPNHSTYQTLLPNKIKITLVKQ